MGSLLNDLKLNDLEVIKQRTHFVNEDVLTWHSVIIDAPINQPSLSTQSGSSFISRCSNDAENTPFKVSFHNCNRKFEVNGFS